VRQHVLKAETNREHHALKYKTQLETTTKQKPNAATKTQTISLLNSAAVVIMPWISLSIQP